MDHETAYPTAGGHWPPAFPHSEIDELIERLVSATDATDPADTAELLRMVAKEAQRLRTAVMRLSVARLSAAEDEANQILADAQDRFERVRQLSLEALDSRLDEAESLSVAMRRAFLAESSAQSWAERRRSPAAPTGAGVEEEVDP